MAKTLALHLYCTYPRETCWHYRVVRQHALAVTLGTPSHTWLSNNEQYCTTYSHKACPALHCVQGLSYRRPAHAAQPSRLAAQQVSAQERAMAWWSALQLIRNLRAHSFTHGVAIHSHGSHSDREHRRVLGLACHTSMPYC